MIHDLVTPMSPSPIRIRHRRDKIAFLDRGGISAVASIAPVCILLGGGFA
jgi:hypothetical protein